MTPFSVSFTQSPEALKAWSLYLAKAKKFPGSNIPNWVFIVFIAVWVCIFASQEALNFLNFGSFNFVSFIVKSGLVAIAAIAFKLYFIPVLVRVSLPFSLRNVRSKNPDFFELHTYSFDDSEMVIQAKDTETRMKYSRIKDVIETQDYFFLTVSHLAAIILPKQHFSNEQSDSIRNLQFKIEQP